MGDTTVETISAIVALLGSLLVTCAILLLLSWPIGWVAHLMWGMFWSGWNASP
jgi:hypothetical protein